MKARNDQVLIIGSGFAGLAMGVFLKRAQIDDFTILEQADDVGGTWRDNHYPGAACDVESHLYSFSFAPNPNWTRMFAPQGEILDYLREIARKFGLMPHIRFRSRVISAEFDDTRGVWTVTTDDGERREARYLVSCVGGLSRPTLPKIAGIHRFRGKAFHSARWDHTYALEGKSVGVIGTGASAIQVVPAIAERVGRLNVFQRTPPWILPKRDRVISRRERSWFRRLPFLQQLSRIALYWQHEAFVLGLSVMPSLMKYAARPALKYLDRSVHDPELRAKLRPSYTMGCKRVLLSNDYYPALQRKNVEVITTPVAEITGSGVTTSDGRRVDLDAIIYCTGFEAADNVAPFDIRGRGGLQLKNAWRDGAEAFLGTTTAGFPNLFFIVGPNTGLGHSSMVLMIEAQARYVLAAIETMRSRRLKTAEVRRYVQDVYNQKLHARLAKTVWASGCVSWYNTAEGKNTTLWPGFTFEFMRRTAHFRLSDYAIEEDQAHVRETPKPQQAPQAV